MKFQGEFAELRFIQECLSRGWNVSTPVGGKSAYDLIVDTGASLVRVQIKSTQRKSTLKADAYRVSAGWGSNSKARYKHSDVDLMACYLMDINTWYLIPIHAIESVNLSLYGHRETRRGQVGRYERFKNLWDIVGQSKLLHAQK